MKLANVELGTTEWSALAPTVHAGTTGTAAVRARQLGDIQIRLVDYGPGYVADHWCAKGHILHVVAGALVIEHEDGRRMALAPACAGTSATTRARRTGWCASAAPGCSSSINGRRAGATTGFTIYGVSSGIEPVFSLFLAGWLVASRTRRRLGGSPIAAVPGSRWTVADLLQIHCILGFAVVICNRSPVTTLRPCARRVLRFPGDAIACLATASLTTKTGSCQPTTGFIALWTASMCPIARLK
jgi:hypothetical protein